MRFVSWCFVAWICGALTGAFHPRLLRAAVVISEVMPANSGQFVDENDSPSDWIELFNDSEHPVALGGWHLTDDPDNKTKWRFPETAIAGRGFLVVFASGKDRRVADRELHASFKLSRGGEYAALTRPDGTIEHEFKPGFPEVPWEDQSYGLFMDSTEVLRLAVGDPLTFLVPGDDSVDAVWRAGDFRPDSMWATVPSGLGYSAPDDVESRAWISTALPPGLRSVYVLVPFEIESPESVDRLVLKLRYDDGFAAFLNGTRVARMNAPATLRWDSTAIVDRASGEAAIAVEFDLSAFRGLLVPGRNVLAIHGLNHEADDGLMILEPEWIVTGAKVRRPEIRGFTSRPTPGGGNGEVYAGFASEPVFSHGSGMFDGVFGLEIVAGGLSGIRYTIDGTLPDAESEVYDGAITVDDSVMIRARTFEPGLLPSPPVSRAFVRIDPDLAEFTSDLPIVVVENFGAGSISGDVLKPAFLGIFDLGNGDRTRLLGVEPRLMARIGIKTRGSSTGGRDKTSYGFEAWDEFDLDVNISPFDMPAASDWILYGPYNFDTAMIRNPLVYALANQAGRYAVRTRFVELFANTGGSAGVDPLRRDDYRGLYVFMEKIKRGAGRVEVDRLDFDDLTEPDVTGGYLLKIDRPDPGDDGFVGGGQVLRYVYPKEEVVMPEQAAWIKSYLDDFGAALRGREFTDPDRGYARYVDVPSFIDHHLINEFTKNPDGQVLSTYMFKPRSGKLTMGPLWDFDRTLGSDDDARSADPVGWTRDGVFLFGWWGRMFDDPDFWQGYRDRWYELRGSVFSGENILGLVDSMADEIREAQARNYQRWPVLSSSESWEGKVGSLKTWITRRLQWMDGQLIRVPVPLFSSGGGSVEAGFELAVSSAAETTYYTMTGRDPRTHGGSIHPSAIKVDQSKSEILVRAGGEWRFMDDGTDLGTAWRDPAFDDSTWKTGVAEFGYGDGDEATLLNRGPSLSRRPTTAYLRTRFDLDRPDRVAGLKIRLLRDDGAVIYLNGKEVARSNMPAGEVHYSTLASSEVSDEEERVFFDLVAFDPPLIRGDNHLAVEVHKGGRLNLDLSFDMEVSAILNSDHPIVIRDPALVRSRSFSGGEWSSEVTARFHVTGSIPAIRFTEVHYAPSNGRAFEFIELTHQGPDPVWIGGYHLEGVAFSFPADTVIGIGETVVIVSNENPAAFAAENPGIEWIGTFGGALENLGEGLTLRDAAGNVVASVGYDERAPWPDLTATPGHSIEWFDPDLDPADPAAWRASSRPGGTPGEVTIGSVAPPVITGVVVVGNRIRFEFNADPGVTYTVLFQETLADPPRVLREYPAQSTGRIIVVEDEPARETSRFYRIQAR